MFRVFVIAGLAATAAASLVGTEVARPRAALACSIAPITLDEEVRSADAIIIARAVAVGGAENRDAHLDRNRITHRHGHAHCCGAAPRAGRADGHTHRQRNADRKRDADRCADKHTIRLLRPHGHGRDA